jgi:hypothetical protein
VRCCREGASEEKARDEEVEAERRPSAEADAHEARDDIWKDQKHVDNGDTEARESKRDKSPQDRHRRSDRDRQDRERKKDRDGVKAARTSDRERREDGKDRVRERGRWAGPCHMLPSFTCLQCGRKSHGPTTCPEGKTCCMVSPFVHCKS